MRGPLSNVHTVTKLPADDLERARAFYRDKLGLEPVEERANLIGIAQPVREAPRGASATRS